MGLRPSGCSHIENLKLRNIILQYCIKIPVLVFYPTISRETWLGAGHPAYCSSCPGFPAPRVIATIITTHKQVSVFWNIECGRQQAGEENPGFSKLSSYYS